MRDLNLTKKSIIKFLLQSFTLYLIYLISTSCKENKLSKEQAFELPIRFSNQNFIKLYDETYDGKFWIYPFYTHNVLVSDQNEILSDGFDQRLTVVAIETVKPLDCWLLKILKNNNPSDTLILKIENIDIQKQIYKLTSNWIQKEHNPFDGYFILTSKNIEPTFYPDREYGSKWDRIVDHRYPINDITAPSPIFFQDFYHTRKDYMIYYNDKTAMELENIDTFIRAKQAQDSYKGKQSIVFDDSCNITLPGFSTPFPHRYIMTLLDEEDSDFNTYSIYIFAKLSSKYSCILKESIMVDKESIVELKLNKESTTTDPIGWSKNESNASYWDKYPEVDPCNSKGGFSVCFKSQNDGVYSTDESVYAYVVDIPNNKNIEPLDLIRFMRWRLVMAVDNEEKIRILSDFEHQILGSGGSAYIAEHAFYNEKLARGLIEAEND